MAQRGQAEAWDTTTIHWGAETALLCTLKLVAPEWVNQPRVGPSRVPGWPLGTGLRIADPSNKGGLWRREGTGVRGHEDSVFDSPTLRT